MAGAVRQSELICSAHKPPIEVPRGVGADPDKVAAFAELVGMCVYEKVMKREIAKMSATEARRFMTRKLEDIGKQKSIGSAFSNNNNSSGDLGF
jgi:hypothetical protein